MKKKLRVQWSCEEMQKGGKRLRFLTLTVPETGLPLRVVADRFRALRHTNFMCNLLKGNQYVCVYEKHPQGHGWHIHVVLNVFVPIRPFRVWANRCGFGRLQIEVCKRNIGKYISKYITKALQERPEDCKGIRMVNVSRGLVALKDIVVSSPAIDFVRRNLNNAAVRSLPMFQRLQLLKRSWDCRLLSSEFCFSMRYLGVDSGLEFF